METAVKGEEFICESRRALLPNARRADFGYIPTLDGLRAVAILLVVLSHYGLDWFIPGGLGVTLFFFISGFLITRLLIAENNKNGEIAIGAFYVRRFLRLGPALLVMIAIVSTAYFSIIGPVRGWEIIAALFYAMNYYSIWFGPIEMPIGVLWSLAVEEHYYAVYPLIFSIAWKFRERFIVWLIAASSVILLWRIFLVLGWRVPISEIYYRTDTRIDSILYGAALASFLAIRKYDKYVTLFAGLKAFIAAMLILILTLVYRDDIFRETLRYSLQGLALVPIFCSLLLSDHLVWVRRILEMPIMIWIGLLSYSIYLWHKVVIFFVIKLVEPNAASSAYWISFPLCVAIASLSYYGVEKPFQTLRRNYRR